MDDALTTLQRQVQDKQGYTRLDDYFTTCRAYLDYLSATRPTRIVSPRADHYIFYQYDAHHAHQITRPLNTHLFIETPTTFVDAYQRFISCLGDLRIYHDQAAQKPELQM